MVIYSRWDPSAGVYEYFESSERPGLNDDLAPPPMPRSTQIGVPSTECGRLLPPGAVEVGSGERAEGLIAVPAGVDMLVGGVPGFEAGRFAWWWVATAFVAGAAAWAMLSPRLRRAA